MSRYFKTIAAPDRGVNSARKPYIINPRSWTVMQQMRGHLGAVSTFPGWSSILFVNFADGPITLLYEFRPPTVASRLIIGGHAKVYRWRETDGALIDISGSATFNATPINPWVATIFNDKLYINNKTDGLYRGETELTGGLTHVAAAPAAKAMSVLGSYLILLNVNDGDEHPQRLQWASEGTDDVWGATPQNDAGRFDLSDTPDFGVALRPLGNDLIAYKERSIVPITFIGGNEVFGRRRAVTGTGLVGPYALAHVGDRHIFMGPEAFYAYAGGDQVDDTIGDPIRERVYSELNHELAHISRTLYLFDTFEVMFMYPDNTATDRCNRCVVYNLKESTWYGPFAIDCTMTGAMNARLNLVRMELFGTHDGNVMQVGASDDDDGEPLTRELESGDHFVATNAVNEEGREVFFPYSSVFMVTAVNIETAHLEEGAAEFYLGHRMDLNDEITWLGPFSISTVAATKIRVPVRATGRWFRVKFVMPESQRFTLLGYQYEFAHVGTRD